MSTNISTDARSLSVYAARKAAKSERHRQMSTMCSKLRSAYRSADDPVVRDAIRSAHEYLEHEGGMGQMASYDDYPWSDPTGSDGGYPWGEPFGVS